MRVVPVTVAIAALSALGCAGPSLAQQRTTAASSIQQLRDGRFGQARSSADQALQSDVHNRYARLVRAIALYRQTMHQLWIDGRTVVIGGIAAGGFNDRYARASFEQAEADLARVDADLADAYRADDIALELCLACWEVDWNGNGRVDERDRLLLQVEVDEHGDEIAPDDPRRKPTFRFDRGDVAWARAFVSFQRAALDVVLAYDLSDLAKAAVQLDQPGDVPIVIHLVHPDRIAAATARLLEGLDQSDRARRDYLAESDDDREWVPSPRQASHPLPLPVDDQLYRTWGQVLGDLRRLVRGEEGLSVSEVAQLGDHRWDNPPRGYVDIGRMLAHPKDIVLHPGTLERADREHDVEAILRDVLGEYYVMDMRASPLPGRLARMKSEVDRGEESMERKLRYLLWLN